MEASTATAKMRDFFPLKKMQCSSFKTMETYAVSSSAVLPYSDDGASGEVTMLSCVKGEREAIKKAIQFMRYYSSRLSPCCEGCCCQSLALKMCDADPPHSFRSLYTWFSLFSKNVEMHVLNNPFYSNPNLILQLLIRDSETDKDVFEAFKSAEECPPFVL